MTADANAYSVLGLEPGADWAAVERAYKALIKLHHPDVPGGDGGRAAEITRAYRELKRIRDEGRQLALRDEEIVPANGRKDWIWFALLAAAIVGALVLASAPADRFSGAQPRAATADRTSAGTASDPMNRPLAMATINAAIRDAVRMSRTQSEAALAGASLDCHRQLRTAPRMDQLDRCVAFDDAVVQLRNRDPLGDQGPFSEIAVTGRQMNAASTLSDDSLAIDSRLDRIRLHVELTLAPALPPVPTESAPASD